MHTQVAQINYTMCKCSCRWVGELKKVKRKFPRQQTLWSLIQIYFFNAIRNRKLNGCLWKSEIIVQFVELEANIYLRMTSKPLPISTPSEPSTVIRFDENGKSWDTKSGLWAFRFYDGLSSTWEFAILTFGVFFFYSWYGICMETFFR